jgi:hypothetical protein
VSRSGILEKFIFPSLPKEAVVFSKDDGLLCASGWTKG